MEENKNQAFNNLVEKEIKEKTGKKITSEIDGREFVFNESKTASKPSANMSLFVFAILIVAAFVACRELFRIATGYVTINIYAFGIISILLGYILGVSFYEVGKLVFSKFSGFKLIRFNLFGLDFLKRNGKTEFSFRWPHGLGVASLFAPKKKNNHVLFLLGGMIFYLAICAVYCVLLFTFKWFNQITYCILIALALGLLVNLYSFMPFKMDTIGDGFLMVLISKPYIREMYYNNLQNEVYLLTGEGELKYNCYDNYYNYIGAHSLAYQYYYFIDHSEYEKAEKVIDYMLKISKFLSEDDVLFANKQKVFFLYYNSNDHEATEKKFFKINGSIRHTITNADDLEAVKSSILISAFSNSSFDEFDHVLEKSNKLNKTYNYQSRVESEEKLIDLALEKIKEEHPDWVDNK